MRMSLVYFYFETVRRPNRRGLSTTHPFKCENDPSGKDLHRRIIDILESGHAITESAAEISIHPENGVVTGPLDTLEADPNLEPEQQTIPPGDGVQEAVHGQETGARTEFLSPLKGIDLINELFQGHHSITFAKRVKEQGSTLLEEQEDVAGPRFHGDIDAFISEESCCRRLH